MEAFESPSQQGEGFYFQPSTEALPVSPHPPLASHDLMFPLPSSLNDDSSSIKQSGSLAPGGHSIDLSDEIVNVEGRYMSDEDIIELICPAKIPSETPDDAELGDDKAWSADQQALGLHKMQETMRPLSTRRSYHQNVRHFIQWCQQQKCRPIPTSERVASFLSHRLTHPWGQARKLTESTLKLSVSALQDARNKLERRTGVKIAGLRQSPVIRSLSKEVPKTNAAAAAIAAAQAAAALAAAGGAAPEGGEEGRGALNGSAAEADEGALPTEHPVYLQEQQQQQQQEAYARSQGLLNHHYPQHLRQHEQYGGHPGEEGGERGAQLAATGADHSASGVTDMEESAAGMMMMRGQADPTDQSAAMIAAGGYLVHPGGLWAHPQLQQQQFHASAMGGYYAMGGAEMVQLAQENGDGQGGEEEDEEDEERRGGAGNEAHGLKRKANDAALLGERSHVRQRFSSALPQTQALQQPWPSGAPRMITFSEVAAYGSGTFQLAREEGAVAINEALVTGIPMTLDAPPSFAGGVYPPLGVPLPQMMPPLGASRAEYSFAGEDDTIAMIWAKFWQRGFLGEKPIVLWMAFIGREEWLRRLATGESEKQQQQRAWWHRALPILLEILVRLKRDNLDVEDSLAEVEHLLACCVPSTVIELSNVLRYSVSAARTLGARCPEKAEEVALLERVVKDRRDAHYLPNPSKKKKG